MKDTAALIDEFFEAYEPRLSDDCVALLRPLLEVVHFPKRHLIVKENQRCNKAYLIMHGSSRSFYLNDGLEVHTWFAFEGEVIGSLQNFNNQVSRVSIELLEDSVLISFDLTGLKVLIQEHIEVLKFVHTAIAAHAQFLEDKFFDLHMKSARERYNALLAHEPEVIARVPLTYIASYIGVSRETLSRLRGK